jgi:hypothetical protein
MPKEPTVCYTWKDVEGNARVTITFDPKAARMCLDCYTVEADGEHVGTYGFGSSALAVARHTVKTRYKKELATQEALS